jgi:pimeloyl-ACP methyl ester carboxylesterase
MRDILATPGISETAGEADIERRGLFRKRCAGPSVDGSDLLHQTAANEVPMTAIAGIAEPDPAFIDVGREADARRIAVRARRGSAPGLFWLSGFNSDMQGTKAVALDAWAAEAGRACVRFDYSGHGTSGGKFVDGTIGRWLEESAAVFSAFCEGPQVVIGSSMGGWVALLLAREIARLRGTGRASLAGLVLIAPAPDFTEELMWKTFPPEVRAEIESKGVWLRPSQYGEPYPITRALIEEGRTISCSGAPSTSAARCASCKARKIPTCRGNTPSHWRTGCPPKTWC